MEKLKEGEVICPECRGKGKMCGVNYSYRICTKCRGARKLDWIEVCMGTRQLGERWFAPPGLNRGNDKNLRKLKKGEANDSKWLCISRI